MSADYAILEPAGFAKDPRTKFQAILLNYCTTQHSCSRVYANIRSLPYTVNYYQNDPDSMAIRIKDDLGALMEGHFDSYTINANVIYLDKPNYYKITVEVKINDNGVSFTDAYTADQVKSGLDEYISFNNNS